MEDIERLVKNLYDPAYSKDVVQIQKQLQDLQKSTFGWKIADEFLANPSTDVRFFGALTLTVKINQDGQSLSENELIELRQKLLSWIICLAEQREYNLVTRKLCTALVTYFALPTVSWRKAVHTLAQCLGASSAIEGDTVDTRHQLSEHLIGLHDRQLSVLLAFTDTLASDGLRIEHAGQRYHEVHQRIATNVEDASSLMTYVFTEKRKDDLVVEEALRALESWLRYIQQEFATGSDQYRYLQATFPAALSLLDGVAAFDKAAKFFVELFSDFDDFVPKHIQLPFSQYINSARSIERLNLLTGEDIDEDAVAYAELVLAFCNLMAKSMIQDPPMYQSLMNIVHSLTKLQALRTEHNISNAVVDFWERFALEAGDFDLDFDDDEEQTGNDADRHSHFQAAKKHCLTAVIELCSVIGHTPNESNTTADTTTDTALSEVRARVTDLVQEAFADFALDILDQLIAFTGQVFDSMRNGGANLPFQDEKSAWMAMEASLALMGTLNIDARSASRQVESKLEPLFNSTFFRELVTPTSAVPKTVRKVVVRLLGKYCGFTVKRIDYINFSLELLFQCLKDPDLMETASRAIFRICDHGRQYTKARIQDLIEATEQFFAATIDEESKSNIIAATAASVQALGTQAMHDQVSYLTKLFTIIEHEYHTRMNQAQGNITTSQSNISAIAEEASHSALQYVKRIAVASQAPDDEPIDLDDDDNNSDKQQTTLFWKGEGLDFQQQVFNFIKALLQAHPGDGQVLEISCDIIRAGYREKTGGPFAFQSSVTVELVISIPIDHPRSDCVMSLAANFIVTHLSPQFKDNEAVGALTQHAANIVIQLKEPQTNPDLSFPCMELFGRLIPIYLEIVEVLRGPALSGMVSFALKCLQAPDLLPKKAASTFWESLFLCSQRHPHDAFVNQLCRELGSELSKTIIFAIGGQAARSELELFTAPLAKMVASQPGTKAWLETWLFDADFPSSRVTDMDKKKLVAQVMSLRGSKKTNGIVREFWTVSKGAPTAYN